MSKTHIELVRGCTPSLLVTLLFLILLLLLQVQLCSSYDQQSESQHNLEEPGETQHHPQRRQDFLGDEEFDHLQQRPQDQHTPVHLVYNRYPLKSEGSETVTSWVPSSNLKPQQENNADQRAFNINQGQLRNPNHAVQQMENAHRLVNEMSEEELVQLLLQQESQSQEATSPKSSSTTSRQKPPPMTTIPGNRPGSSGSPNFQLSPPEEDSRMPPGFRESFDEVLMADVEGKPFGVKHRPSSNEGPTEHSIGPERPQFLQEEFGFSSTTERRPVPQEGLTGDEQSSQRPSKNRQLNMRPGHRPLEDEKPSQENRDPPQERPPPGFLQGPRPFPEEPDHSRPFPHHPEIHEHFSGPQFAQLVDIRPHHQGNGLRGIPGHDDNDPRRPPHDDGPPHDNGPRRPPHDNGHPRRPSQDDGPSGPPHDNGPRRPPHDNGPRGPLHDNGPRRPPHDNGPRRPPHESGPGRPPHDNGPGRPPHDNGPGRQPQDNGPGRPPHDNGPGRPPHDNGRHRPQHNDNGPPHHDSHEFRHQSPLRLGDAMHGSHNLDHGQREFRRPPPPFRPPPTTESPGILGRIVDMILPGVRDLFTTSSSPPPPPHGFHAQMDRPHPHHRPPFHPHRDQERHPPNGVHGSGFSSTVKTSTNPQQKFRPDIKVTSSTPRPFSQETATIDSHLHRPTMAEHQPPRGFRDDRRPIRNQESQNHHHVHAKSVPEPSPFPAERVSSVTPQDEPQIVTVSPASITTPPPPVTSQTEATATTTTTLSSIALPFPYTTRLPPEILSGVIPYAVAYFSPFGKISGTTPAPGQFDGDFFLPPELPTPQSLHIPLDDSVTTPASPASELPFSLSDNGAVPVVSQELQTNGNPSVPVLILTSGQATPSTTTSLFPEESVVVQQALNPTESQQLVLSTTSIPITTTPTTTTTTTTTPTTTTTTPTTTTTTPTTTTTTPTTTTTTPTTTTTTATTTTMTPTTTTTTPTTTTTTPTTTTTTPTTTTTTPTTTTTTPTTTTTTTPTTTTTTPTTTTTTPTTTTTTPTTTTTTPTTTTTTPTTTTTTPTTTTTTPTTTTTTPTTTTTTPTTTITMTTLSPNQQFVSELTIPESSEMLSLLKTAFPAELQNVDVPPLQISQPVPLLDAVSTSTANYPTITINPPIYTQSLSDNPDSLSMDSSTANYKQHPYLLIFRTLEAIPPERRQRLQSFFPGFAEYSAAAAAGKAAALTAQHPSGTPSPGAFVFHIIPTTTPPSTTATTTTPTTTTTTPTTSTTTPTTTTTTPTTTTSPTTTTTTPTTTTTTPTTTTTTPTTTTTTPTTTTTTPTTTTTTPTTTTTTPTTTTTTPTTTTTTPTTTTTTTTTPTTTTTTTTTTTPTTTTTTPTTTTTAPTTTTTTSKATTITSATQPTTTARKPDSISHVMTHSPEGVAPLMTPQTVSHFDKPLLPISLQHFTTTTASPQFHPVLGTPVPALRSPHHLPLISTPDPLPITLPNHRANSFLDSLLSGTTEVHSFGLPIDDISKEFFSPAIAQKATPVDVRTMPVIEGVLQESMTLASKLKSNMHNLQRLRSSFEQLAIPEPSRTWAWRRILHMSVEGIIKTSDLSERLKLLSTELQLAKRGEVLARRADSNPQQIKPQGVQ